ncbi:hypothetical protein [Streptomyces justiciae]|uniref:hypothetical protein n=1 Tax=Streptomyces justiciae TaxID=2780140 RepID=UPI002ADDD035|nr:hypothetical protein [Streptomyces justiciae]
MAVRTGSSQARAAGAVVRLEEAVGDGEPDAVRPDLAPLDGRVLGDGSSGAGESSGWAGELLELLTPGLAAPLLSSGTTRTSPVGFADEGGSAAGPTAV